jgi:mannose-6-phosphate isomerase-like protein (cupin superfamily)
MAEVSGGIVLLPGEARGIDVGGFDVTVYADRETTAGNFSLIETGESTVGGGPPLHVHRDCAESFYVLAGRYAMILGRREFVCPVGSFVFVPKGMTHTFRTLEAGSRKLNLYTPAGMVGYFDELASGIAAGMKEAELDRIAARYEMDVVGPVPDGYLASS